MLLLYRNLIEYNQFQLVRQISQCNYSYEFDVKEAKTRDKSDRRFYIYDLRERERERERKRKK